MTILRFAGEYAFLSNFYSWPIMVRGENFKTVEHAFQAWKMTTWTDALKVRNQSTPGLAKRMARTLPMREDWEDIKRAVMFECCFEKFKSGEMRTKLLATGDEKLEEGNAWGDTYWGICKGVGTNWLGRILMQIRDEHL